MINISELKVFVMAAEELNFSRAAQQLRMSQSAVSQNIQAVEQAYGVELFVRHGRSVQLSEAGQALLPIARNVLHSANLLEDALINAKGEVTGELTIGCATTSGRYFIPNLLARFQREYPKVRTRMILMRREAVIDGLLNQTLNFGVLGHCFGHRDLECQPVFEDRIILIVPRQHPWANVSQVKPQEILEQPFIGRELSSGTYKELLDYSYRKGVNPENLNVVMELGDAEAVQMAVENGIGITFISEVMAARSLALGRVKKVDVEDFNVTQRIALSRHISRVYTRAEAKLWEFVEQHRQELASDLLCNLADVTQK